MRLADYVLEKLCSEGVKNTFCVTGRGSLFLTDALKKNKQMDSCFMHHEQSAAFATNASTVINDKSSCCMISTGCSSFNALTGVLCAWQDNIPSIFISGQNFLKETTSFTKSKKKTFGQQEANIIDNTKFITKFSTMVTNPKKIRYIIEKAIFLANQAPKGPVWLDIPLDIQNSYVDTKTLKGFKKKINKSICSNKDLNFVLNQLEKSKRPIVLMGNGIKSAGAQNELKEFIKKYQIPLVYSTAAPDVYGSKNKLSIGSVGSQGCSRAGNFAMQNSDLLLVLGSRLNSNITGGDTSKFARNSKIIIIDINKNEHEEKFKNKKLIISDLVFFLKNMNKKKAKIKYNKWLNKCIYWKKLFSIPLNLDNDKKKIGLYRLSKIFSDVMPKKSIFICDSGFIDVIMPTNIEFGNNQSCVHPVSQGSMGFAVPAAAGIQRITDRPIICVVGDGSVMMNLQELQTIFNNKTPVKIFIINNNLYGIIRRRQKILFRNRTVGTDKTNGISTPKFKDIAKAFRIKYLQIKDKTNVKNKIKKIFNLKSSIICEIYASENQNYLEISYGKTQNGKYVKRPLEDQAPFLDRNLLLEEMIIKPIDL